MTELWVSYRMARLGVVGMVVSFVATLLFFPSWFAWAGATWFVISTFFTFWGLTDINPDMERHRLEVAQGERAEASEGVELVRQARGHYDGYEAEEKK